MPQVPVENYIGTNTRGSPLLDLAKLKCYKQRYTKYCAYGTAAPSNKVTRARHELGVCDCDKLVTNRIYHHGHYSVNRSRLSVMLEPLPITAGYQASIIREI